MVAGGTLRNLLMPWLHPPAEETIEPVAPGTGSAQKTKNNSREQTALKTLHAEQDSESDPDHDHELRHPQRLPRRDQTMSRL